MTTDPTSIDKITRTLRCRDFGYLVIAFGLAATLGAFRSPDLFAYQNIALVTVFTGLIIEILLLFFKCPHCGHRFFSGNLFLSIGNLRCGHCKVGTDGINP